MSGLFLYGSGKRCKILLGLLGDLSFNVRGIVDTNENRWGLEIEGHIICSPNVLRNVGDSFVCVTFYSSLVEEPIWKQLEEIGVKKEKIVSFHQLLLMIYEEKQIIPLESIKDKRWKNIFDASWELGLGGVESWIKVIVRELINAEEKDTYLVTGSNQQNMPVEIEKCIIDFRLDNYNEFSEESVQKCIELILKELPCTIVFSRVDELMLAASLIKPFYKDYLRIVMADHGSCDGMFKDVLSYREFIDYYMCVSSGIKNILLKNGIREDMVEVMTCPVDFKTELSRKYALDKKNPIKIGYAGRLEVFEKRIDILQKLIENLEIKKVNYQVSIAGDGTQYDVLNEFIGKKRLNSKIFLLGRLERSRMSDFWMKQDIAINTSDNEGRPLSNMEAMINGAVPIVTCTVGILDDVHEGENGYIVPIEDAEQMAEKIAYLEENRFLLEQFGGKAREEMLNKVDVNKHVKQWQCVLAKVR